MPSAAKSAPIRLFDAGLRSSEVAAFSPEIGSSISLYPGIFVPFGRAAVDLVIGRDATLRRNASH